METVKIYLSGVMDVSLEEYHNDWRNKIIGAIKFEDYNYDKKPLFFNPVDYYNLEDKHHKSEREVLEFNLNALRKSDLVIVNLDEVDLINTTMELAIAYEKKIPIIALSKNKEVHPWIKCCCNRMCGNMRELVEYVVEFYLN